MTPQKEIAAKNFLEITCQQLVSLWRQQTLEGWKFDAAELRSSQTTREVVQPSDNCAVLSRFLLVGLILATEKRQRLE